jgi:EmrB/QacA subfamily drug resistance transporter
MLIINDENRRWWILIAVGVGGGLILLDETVLGVALPSLRRDLGMSQTTSHWVINAYFLAFAGFAAAGGKLADLIGLRRMMLGSIITFGLASLAAGFAENATWLITARAVQGFSAAVIYPATLGMITAAFPKEQHGLAIGYLASIGTTFLMAGPVVGGFFTEILSWRWIFWVNVPMAITVVCVILAAWTDAPRGSERPRTALYEFPMLMAGIGLIVFAIMQSGEWGWRDPVIPASLVAGLVVIAAFIVLESRREAPLIDVLLFRNPGFAACNLVFFTSQYIKITVVVFIALYLQHVLGLTPMTAGLCLLVAMVGSPLMSSVAGRMGDKYGVRLPALCGLIGVGVSLLWITALLGADKYGLLVPGLFLWGFALQFCFVPTGHAVMKAVPADKQGQAGGIITTVRLLGGTFGMAVNGTVLALTGSYRALFIVTLCVLAATLIFAFVFLERRPRPTAA